MKSIALTSMIAAVCLAAAGCTPTPTTGIGTAIAAYTYNCSGSLMTVTVEGNTATVNGGGTFTGGPSTYYGQEESLTFAADYSSVVWAGLGEQETCYLAG